jgi:predicted enzyme related to lactoylglutathione lyase
MSQIEERLVLPCFLVGKEGGQPRHPRLNYLNQPGARTSAYTDLIAYQNIHRLNSSKGEEMANPFVHVELNSPDPEKAKKIYVKLLQWQLEDMPNSALPGHSYTVIRVGEGTGGGIMKQVPHGPAGWIPYVQVDDLRVATDKAKSLGGKVMKDVTEVPDMGWFSIIEDPTGAILGLWKSNPKTMQADHGAKEKALSARKQGAETPARAH